MKELSMSGLIVYFNIGKYFSFSSSSSSSLVRTTQKSKWFACPQVGELRSMLTSLRPSACSTLASCIAFICQALGCITLGAVNIKATGLFGKVAGTTDVVVARAVVVDGVVVMLSSFSEIRGWGGKPLSEAWWSHCWCQCCFQRL